MVVANVTFACSRSWGWLYCLSESGFTGLEDEQDECGFDSLKKNPENLKIQRILHAKL